jgi:integrase
MNTVFLPQEAFCVSKKREFSGLGDVDLRERLVTVRQSKFFKSRLVPLGPQLMKALANYAARCEGAGYPQGSGSPFFPARGGGPINIVTLQANFARIRKRADIRRVDGGRYQPRIHDLRQHADSPIMPTPTTQLSPSPLLVRNSTLYL